MLSLHLFLFWEMGFLVKVKIFEPRRIQIGFVSNSKFLGGSFVLC